MFPHGVYFAFYHIFQNNIGHVSGNIYTKQNLGSKSQNPIEFACNATVKFDPRLMTCVSGGTLKIKRLFIDVFVVVAGSAQNTGQGIDLSSRPPSGRTTPGREVTFTCTLDLSIVSDNPVVWARTIGSIRMNIALGTIKQDEFVPMGRYKLSTWPEAGNKKTYTLTIASKYIYIYLYTHCS